MGTDDAREHFCRLLQPFLERQQSRAESFPFYTLAVRGRGRGVHNQMRLQYHLHPMSLVVCPTLRAVILADPAGYQQLRNGTHAFISLPLRPKGTRESQYPYNVRLHSVDPDFVQGYWKALQPPGAGPVTHARWGPGEVPTDVVLTE